MRNAKISSRAARWFLPKAGYASDLTEQPQKDLAVTNADKAHLALDHSPTLPARDSVIGEGVFLTAWQQLMVDSATGYGDGPHPCLLHSILAHLPDPVEQRHATVAATFVKWLGTNGGRDLLDRADRLKGRGFTPVSAYCAAWATVNRRDPCISHGIRTIEGILGPIELVTEIDNYRQISKWLPKLSVADYETVEAIVEWLPSLEGVAFLGRCQAKIQKAHTAKRQAELEAFKKKNSQ